MAKSITTHRGSSLLTSTTHSGGIEPRSDRAALVLALGEQLRQIEGARFTASAEVISSGHAALDRLLPEGGFRRGSLVEWLSSGAGSGAATLALAAARPALENGQALVVVDRRRRFYPPAALRLGIPLERMIVVRPANDADQAWALDQALRSRGVAAVWAAVEQAEDSTLRRWQLAAETSGVLGFLLRSKRARREPSWAELRLGIEPVASEARTQARAPRLRVQLLRSRLGRSGSTVELELPFPATWPGDHETYRQTHPVPLDSSLAAAKARRRPKRA